MSTLRFVLIATGLVLLGPPRARSEETVSPYAVCAHLSRGGEHQVARQELRLMHEAGIGWARTDFDWSGVQPGPGVWRFDHLDRTVDWAEAEGVRILPILDYDVPWARPAHQHLDQWLEYVRRVTTRYKDRLRYWEVWNEPNLEGFWRDTPRAADYVKLLKATYGEIKRIDPDLVVLQGGTAGLPWSYLEGIYEAGGRPYFDVMNVHPYRYPHPPEGRPLYDDLGKLRRLMAGQGDAAKPIWITEIGWPTHEGPRGVAPDIQARMLARAYLLAFQAGVEVVFWYEFQAPEQRPEYNEHHFGMVHRDLAPKPAYTALAALARARPAGSKTLEGPWRTGDVYHPHWRRPDGQTAWALWRIGEEQTLALRIEGKIAGVFDHLGQRLELPAEGESPELKLGESPVYIIGPTGLNVPAAEEGRSGELECWNVGVMERCGMYHSITPSFHHSISTKSGSCSSVGP